MDPLQLAALAVTGVLAGAINTVAGGGSLITLPVLILLGMPATVANGTNRVGVVIQSATATWRYQRTEGLLDLRLGGWLLVPTCIGAALGAWASTDLDDTTFRQVIGVVMLAMLVVLLARPKRWLDGRAGQIPRHRRWTSPVAFLVIGAYGGFLQAGVGIFLLAGLVLLEGRDLLRANAVKVLLVTGFTVPPLVIFVAADLVEWVPGLVLAAGSAVGAWLGTRMTVSWGPSFIRWVMVAVVTISASKLLGLW